MIQIAVAGYAPIENPPPKARAGDVAAGVAGVPDH
jgi:hypothetical protein